MLNGMVLVCVDCGNVELEVKCIGEGTKIISFFCPQCGNLGRMQGFAAGPVQLGAEKIREIKDKAEKTLRKRSGSKAESNPIVLRMKEKGIPDIPSFLIKEA